MGKTREKKRPKAAAVGSLLSQPMENGSGASHLNFPQNSERQGGVGEAASGRWKSSSGKLRVDESEQRLKINVGEGRQGTEEGRLFPSPLCPSIQGFSDEPKSGSVQQAVAEEPLVVAVVAVKNAPSGTGKVKKGKRSPAKLRKTEEVKNENGQKTLSRGQRKGSTNKWKRGGEWMEILATKDSTELSMCGGRWWRGKKGRE